ncbi:MAG: aldo/keto reductase [Prolixibacteraceae bacterium]|nr:aldo/keto reductase [Prolixibacteraceae bacterium]MBN2774191.1 aldo/keto reductase [Prolixibacteraceae bacterium]
MEYRQFGKTGKKISVITLGGMRYLHGWDHPREVIPESTLEQGIKTVEMALKFGINHIETAYGYIKSEHLYGKILNDILKVDRNSYYLMTKGSPKTAKEVRPLIENQLKALKTDYFDFYGWHGINNLELFETACVKGGPVEELLKLKEEGIINHIGFSTHAILDVIIKSIETGLFEFVNLHYYYFFQRNKPAVDLAESKKMGVFIISPNDKGGQLFNPPEKLKELTSPFNPLHWNARFCLSNPAIHTLSFGLPTIDQLDGILPSSVPLSSADQKIKDRLDEQVLNDPYAYFDGYCMENDPSGINIPEILRFRKLWKCYGMEGFGKYRYNMFQEKDHWFHGIFPTEENLKKINLSKCPDGIPVVDLIRETHKALYKP